MGKRFRLVSEGFEGPMPGSWGFRIGQQLPGGQVHWVCNWIPGQQLHEKAFAEQSQVMEDLWANLCYRIMGVQQQLFS